MYMFMECSVCRRQTEEADFVVKTYVLNDLELKNRIMLYQFNCKVGKIHVFYLFCFFTCILGQ